MDWRNLVHKREPKPALELVRPVLPVQTDPEMIVSIRVEDEEFVGWAIGRFTRQKINGIYEIVDNVPAK